MSRDIPFDDIDDIVVGETLGPLETVVDGKVIEKYCDEFRDYNPLYLEDSPFGGPVVPPAFMEVFTGPKLLGTKYRAQSPVPTKSVYEFINPARVGKRLITTGKIVDKYVKRGLEYVVIEAMMVDEDGVEIRRNIHHIVLSLEERATG